MEENIKKLIYGEITEKMEELDWDVHIREEKDNHISISLGTYSPEGQDFWVEIYPDENLCDFCVSDLCKEVYDRYESYDVNEETSLWIGDDGHGKNGAPYEVIDIYNDMKWCKDKIYELYEALKKYE